MFKCKLLHGFVFSMFYMCLLLEEKLLMLVLVLVLVLADDEGFGKCSLSMFLFIFFILKLIFFPHLVAAMDLMFFYVK